MVAGLLPHAPKGKSRQSAGRLTKAAGWMVGSRVGSAITRASMIFL